MPLDLVLAGADVVTPSGVARADVGIEGERIAVIEPAGGLAQSGTSIVDLRGKILVPGGIDPHIHCSFRVYDPVTDSTTYTGGPDVVSTAALHGGTTTLIDFVHPAGEEELLAATAKQTGAWRGNCRCDFSFHVVLRDRVSPAILAQVPAVIDAGLPSFKVFTTNGRPSFKGMKIDYGSLWELMQVVAANNGIIAAHAEDDELVMHMYEKLTAEGRVGYENLPLVRSAVAEDLAFRRIIRLAEHVPGAALYMMHVSAGDAVAAVADARAKGLPVYAETLHQYALRTQDNYREPDGMKYHNYPSLKTKADTAAIWRAVATGDVSTFATDELCTSYAIKTAGNRIDNVTGGNTGVEPRMAIVYTEVVTKRELGLRRFVDVTSANAAKILGLYPQKGAIAVGSDADIAVLDPNQSRTVTAAELHESDYTPWEGWRVSAWPVMTLLRGKVVVADGKLTASLNDGRIVTRRLSSAVHAGSAA